MQTKMLETKSCWDTGTLKMQTGCWDTGTSKMQTIWDTETVDINMRDIPRHVWPDRHKIPGHVWTDRHKDPGHVWTEAWKIWDTGTLKMQTKMLETKSCWDTGTLKM